MMKFVMSTATRFADEEEGIALTEYLVLLGLLVAGVIGAVVIFGNELTNVWTSWSDWFAGGAIDGPSA
jgi:pilus assembly protein Flp/PilA